MRDYIQLARPNEWVKNLAVFAGPAFGLRLLDPVWFGKAAIAFAAFCLVASASYAINDTLDREADARHPSKKHRPIARGAIRPITALVFGGVLAVGGVALSSALLPREATLLVALYFALIQAYSIALKNRVLLDVIIVAIGFVLRAWAGAAAVEVLVSPWLIICTFMICMFMGFGKRRCELATLGNVDNAREHRRTLLRYTPELLNHLISVTAGIAIITFVLYTTDKQRPAPFPKEHLLYTLPLVVYGVFRYAMLTESGSLHGPTEILLKDRPFLGTIVLWGLIAIGVVYQGQLRGWLGF
ncbi:MAG: decaprenyl-phosphate phosphoribosyltransferase [Planctomycetota bacterium]|jgi:4-hydroxybenzoate polyprenyltransferase